MRNSKSINVLFLIYDLERGGPEMRLLDFAKYFPEDISIHICVTSERLALLDEFRARDIKVKVLPIEKVHLSISKIFNLFHYCRLHNIKIINVFDLKGLIIAFMIRVMAGFQTKVVYHNVNSLIEFPRVTLFLFYSVLRFCNACICNSIFSKKEIKKIIPICKIHIIHNGVDHLFFKKNALVKKRVRSNLKIQEDEILIGIIANFRKQKNHPFLLKAFGALSPKYKNLKLLCVGGGKYLEQSKSIAKTRNLDKKIIFIGYTKHVVEYLNAIDILVLPSLWEGLPNALLQAMSMEIPVVASNVGGCSEIVCHMKNGILFPSNDIGEFTTHLEMIINEKTLANEFGRNARKTVEEKFSIDRMIKEYIAFYKKLSES